MFFLSPEYSVNQSEDLQSTEEILFTFLYRLDDIAPSLYLYIQYWLKREENTLFKFANFLTTLNKHLENCT